MLKKLIFSGNIPYSAVAVIAALALYVGSAIPQISPKPTPKVAFAEKGVVVMEALFGQEYVSEAALDEQIKKPMLAVIKRYVDKGYVVIDASRDENGKMAIAGIPVGAIDITAELKAALKLPIAGKAPQAAAPTGQAKQ